MGRKTRLFGLLAIFAAISLVTATGAFTSVEASRTATVNVAGDGSALLAMDPAEGPNGDEYARISNGELEINLAGYTSSATGVNPNATTDVKSVFVITNQGSQEVEVGITDSGDNDGAVTFYNASDPDTSAAKGGLEPGGANATLSPGDSVTVSIEVDTTGLSGTPDLVDGITITAQATSN
ncbi:DUF1102 domain-containing protein [Halobellus ordinarius]|uniref:DUF1102 domain-containing protein n=1 Tax=Halobellus ordinarius TaxID=3075120 RepID=UPI002880A6B0|nr:DUF1102 domain-containing protein [Halobellus sp. ZY16]